MEIEKAKEISNIVEQIRDLAWRGSQITQSNDLRGIIRHIEDDNRSNGTDKLVDLENIRSIALNAINKELTKLQTELNQL